MLDSPKLREVYSSPTMFNRPRKSLLRLAVLLMVVSLGMTCFQAVSVHSHADKPFDSHCVSCKAAHPVQTAITAVPRSIEMGLEIVGRLSIHDEPQRAYSHQKRPLLESPPLA